MMNDYRWPRKYLIMILMVVIFCLIFLNQWLPVVYGAQVTNVRHVEHGVLIDVKFYKHRNCEFKGVSWYDKDSMRRSVIFPKIDLEAPQSRPVGKQVAKNWLIFGMRDFEGSYAFTHHICNGFRKISFFYP